MIAVRTAFFSPVCWGILLVALFMPMFAMAEGVAIYPGSLPVLAGVQKVRDELKLTSLQRAVLNSIRNEYRSEAQEIYAATNFKDPASREYAQTAVYSLQRKYNRRALSTLNKTQKIQLKHIEARTLGGFLLFRASVQQSLLINAQQKVKISKIEAKILKTLQRLNKLSIQEKLSASKRALALYLLRENASAELLDVLTPAQRQQLAAIM